MPRVINITDKLSNEKPMIVWGEKKLFVNNSMGTVFKFEELAGKGTRKSFIEALELALGKKEAKEINIDEMSTDNFKVLITAIMASMQSLTYEEAEARFRQVQP